MARSKSTSGSKTNRSNANQEQTSKEQPGNISPANAPEVKAVRAEAAPVDVKPEVKPEAKIAPEPKIALEPRKKLEMVRNDSRRLVPINLEDEIRRRAYELYEQRGPGSGHESDDWLTAEREVQQRYHQQQQSA